MITYTPAGNGFLVYKDGKAFGRIRQIAAGFQYLPEGYTGGGGDIFHFVEHCKKALENKWGGRPLVL